MEAINQAAKGSSRFLWINDLDKAVAIASIKAIESVLLSEIQHRVAAIEDPTLRLAVKQRIEQKKEQGTQTKLEHLDMIIQKQKQRLGYTEALE